MPEGFFPALPQAKAFGIEGFDWDKFKQWINGEQWSFKKAITIQGDLVSSNWDGAQPLDLSAVDTTATAGFALDSSEGSAQFEGDIFLGGNLTLSGGTIQTATSGNRVVIDSGGIEVHVSSLDNPSTIWGGGGNLLLTAAYDGTNNRAYIQLAEGSGAEVEFGKLGTANAEWAAINGTAIYPKGTQGIRNVDGSVGTPSYSFDNDPDSGIFRAGSGSIGFAMNGLGVTLSSDGTYVTFQDDASAGNRFLFKDVNEIEAAGGAANDPSYTFTGDTDSGWYRTGANAVAVTVGAEPRMSWAYQAGSGTGVYMHEDLTDVGNHETLRLDRTGGGSNLVEIGYFSSWQRDPVTGKKAKVNIKPLSKSLDLDIIDQVAPISFKRVSTKQHEWGFRLEDFKELGEEWRYMTTKGDQWGYSPDEMAFIAVLWESNRELRATNRDLIQRVEALEMLVAA